ncbi:unnamed protein product [Phytomonas sp. EM1]|nr:unnamed protein product [Phytomonas sp. EM1]|eukprot:CCW60172.1 unnamed protein product [Phytomonas sp. isolate EM1]
MIYETPQVQVGLALIENEEALKRWAMVTEEECKARYYAAKRNYKLTMDRYGLYGDADTCKKKGKSISSLLYTPEGYIEFGSCFRPEDSTESSELEELNKELRELAQSRGFSNRYGKTLLSLIQRQREEYKDIITLQNAGFCRLAKQYYNLTYGVVNNFILSEVKARKQIEDLEMAEGVALMKMLRECISECEERIIRRTFGEGRLIKESDEEEESGPPVLDSMYAVPLSQRVMVIREETMSEESIAFSNLQLAMLTQADLFTRELLWRNAITGTLQRVPGATIPFHFRDSVAYAFKSEGLCITLDEETERMIIIEQEQQEIEMLFSLCHPEVAMEESKQKNAIDTAKTV